MVPSPPARPPGPHDTGAAAGSPPDHAHRVEEAVEAALATLDGAPVPAATGPARRAATVVEALRAARTEPR